MGPLDLIRNLAGGTVLSILLVAVAGVFCVVALVALRFLRRGSARFWLVAGYVALTLLPIALGTALSGWRVGILSKALSQIESGPSVAMRAGFTEALVPLLFGFLVASGLSLLAFGLIAAGRRSETKETGAMGVLGPGAALALVVATIALALCIPLAGRALAAASASSGSLANTALIGGVVCTLMAIVAGILLVLKSPRGAAPVGVRVVAVGAPALIGLVAMVVAIAGTVWLSSSLKAAMAGVPLGTAAGDDVSPPVSQPWEEPDLATPMPPPPPPPTPRPMSVPAAGGPAPTPRPRAEESARSTTPAARPPTAAPAEQTLGSPVRVGGRIKEPKRLRSVNPVYPAIARQARAQGVVILECTISPQGKVTQVKVLRGMPLLNQAAIDAVEQWEYEPTLLNGIPVPVIMTVTVNFKMH